MSTIVDIILAQPVSMEIRLNEDRYEIVWTTFINGKRIEFVPTWSYNCFEAVSKCLNELVSANVDITELKYSVYYNNKCSFNWHYCIESLKRKYKAIQSKNETED